MPKKSVAIISKLQKSFKEQQGKQTEVACSYKVIENAEGKKVLQIETYRASDTAMEGNPTQILQFTPEALKQLAKIVLVDILLKEK